MREIGFVLIASVIISFAFIQNVDAFQGGSKGKPGGIGGPEIKPFGENLTWTLDGETLTIGGTGDMPNFNGSTSSPWNSVSSRIKTIVIEEGVSSVGDWAFYDIHEAMNVSIANSVKSIGANAFVRCLKLATISIPAGVSSIGSNAFQRCEGLKSIEVDEDNKQYSSKNGILFNHACTVLIKFPPGHDSTNYTTPSGLNSIEEFAFEECNNLTSVIIGDGVRVIGDSCFSLCKEITEVTIAGSVKSIGALSFTGCSSLTKLDIRDGVESIGDNAFASCKELTSISIPSSVASIGEKAFFDCQCLESIEVSKSNSNYISVGGVLFNHQSTTLIQYPPKKNDKSYVIPDGVKTVGIGAFSHNKHLESVSIPHSVTSIEDSAFQDCSELVKVNIPKTVASIRRHTFCGCGNMKHIDIPDSVTSIEDNAFDSSGLASVVIPGSVESIGDYAFMSSYSLENVTILEGVKTIGVSCFASCGSIKSLCIPSSIAFVGTRAFADVRFLTELYYQGSIDLPFSDTFGRYSPTDLCVPPDYGTTSFCGINVPVPSARCQEYRSLFNHCFQAANINGEFIQQERRNATIFESRSNGCVECHCHNKSGPVWWSLCNSTDEVTRFCVNDECTEKKEKESETEWSVVVAVDAVDPSSISASEIVDNISSLTGIDTEKAKITFEVDDKGYIIGVVIYTKDKNSALLIAETAKGCEQ